MTSSKTKGKNSSEPLNRVNLCYDKAGPSGTKDVSSETSSKQHETPVRKEKPNSSFHKSAEELIAKKTQLNARYRKNLKERNRFWKNKNSNQSSINLERSSNKKVGSSQILKTKSIFSTKSQVLKPVVKLKPKSSPQSQFSKPLNKSKDFKGKTKFVLEPEVTLKEYEANLKKEEKDFVTKMAPKYKEFIERKSNKVSTSAVLIT